MLLGAEFLVPELLGFILSASFLIFQAFVSGTALLNSKILIDSSSHYRKLLLNSTDTERIQKEGVIYASASIAELYSLSFKDASPVLILFMVFNAGFTILGARYFESAGYISQAVGLK